MQRFPSIFCLRSCRAVLIFYTAVPLSKARRVQVYAVVLTQWYHIISYAYNSIKSIIYVSDYYTVELFSTTQRSKVSISIVQIRTIILLSVHLTLCYMTTPCMVLLFQMFQKSETIINIFDILLSRPRMPNILTFEVVPGPGRDRRPPDWNRLRHYLQVLQQVSVWWLLPTLQHSCRELTTIPQTLVLSLVPIIVIIVILSYN